MQEIMVLESVTCIRFGGRKVFAYYVGLTILTAFSLIATIQTMMMYLILAFAQKSQQQPGSRRSQEVELVIWTDGSTNNKLERRGAGIFIEDKKVDISWHNITINNTFFTSIYCRSFPCNKGTSPAKNT